MDFILLLAIFVLACFVVRYVVRSVTRALHKRSMAVTNAVSSLIIVGALIAALAAPSAARAQAEQGEAERYAVVWLIMPDGPVEPTMWVSPRRSITSARLQAFRAFELSADVTTPEGKVLLPAGASLVRLDSKTLVACSVNPPAEKGLAGVWNFGTDRYVCLADQDRDGRFDQSFGLRTFSLGLLTGTGRLPRDRLPIAPASYVEVDPAKIEARHIYIRYEGFASLVGKLQFAVCFSGRGEGLCLAPGVSVKRSRIPVEFEMLGARFRVDAKVEDRVQVTMLSPIVPAPLVIRNY